MRAVVAKDRARRYQEFLRQAKRPTEPPAADPNVHKFVVVPTQGTLQPTASDWQNEIHPSPAGFTKIAQKFQASLATIFP
jgi:hypothetical protein